MFARPAGIVVIWQELTEAPPTKGYVKIRPSQTVEVGVDESLCFQSPPPSPNFHALEQTNNFASLKCIELPTLFVYDTLNNPDLTHFSGTEFIDTGCSCSPDFVLVQTNTSPNRQRFPLLPYMVAVESADYDNHDFDLCYCLWFVQN